MKKTICLLFALLMFSNILNARTLFLGDSLTQKIGENYKKNNEDTDLNYVIGSGLENKKIDWIERINNVDIDQYNKIVISMGTNDWGIYNDGNYKMKIENFIYSLNKKNKELKIIWILPPIIKNEKVNNGVKKVKNIIKKVCIEKNIEIIDPNDIFGKKYTDLKNNQKIRTQDGIHYTDYGAKIIAQKVK